MRGQLIPRGDGVWELRAYAGYDPVKKRGRYIHRTFRGKQRAAEAELAKLIREAEARKKATGPAKVPAKTTGPRTVREGFEEWRRHVDDHLEPNGRDEDRRDLENYVYPHIGDVGLWQIRPQILAVPGDTDYDPDHVALGGEGGLYEILSRRGAVGRLGKGGTRNGKGGPLRASTIRRTHGVLLRGFEYCVARNWMMLNPAVGAPLPPVTRRVSTMPQADALVPLLEWLARDDPDLWAWMHMMNSGARRVDIGVRWSEHDPVTDEVTFGMRGVIVAKNAQGREELLIRETATKKRRLRTVVLGSQAAAALKVHRYTVECRAADCGVSLSPDAYIFSGRIDGSVPYRPDWATKAWRKACGRAEKAGIGGFEKVRMYDIRHFMGSTLLAANVPAAVVAEMMGNSERTLDQFYRQPVKPAVREAAAAMDRILNEASQPKRG